MRARPHYLAAMPLPRPARPSVLWSDLRAFWRDRPRHQWVAAALSVSIPIGIVFSFYLDSYTNILPRETITYVESWPANRSDEQIKAEQKIDQAARDKARKERQEQFKRLDEKLERLGI